MTFRFPVSLQSLVTVCVALVAPALVGVAGELSSGWASPLARNIAATASMLAIVLAAFSFSMHRNKLPLRQLGFAESGWRSIPIGLLLAAFLVFVYGPILTWALHQSGAGAFENGMDRLAPIPTWALLVTIIIMASAEELLYRAYAIEVLGPILGSRSAAGAAAVLVFSLAHVPFWGWAAASTTLAAGALLTIIYLWRADVLALMIAHVAADIVGLVIVPRAMV
jgi:membrane protease YdiL (CAAX protease family)